MKSKWRMPHPATMFLLLTMAVVFLSWICDIYGLKVTLPQSGEDIRVQSLLSPEGIRWWLRNAIKNFTGFAPLGMVIIAMFGLGVAQHSGFIDACIRLGVGNRKEKRKVILWVIVLGLLSNVIGDGGYIILLPIAAMLFQWVGLHPIAGIVTAYVSVACGYSANIVLSTDGPVAGTYYSGSRAYTDGISGKHGAIVQLLFYECFDGSYYGNCLLGDSEMASPNFRKI